MKTGFNIAQILVAVVLVLIILLQLRGGGLGGIFGSQTSTFRTRRGFEKTLFQLTIVLAVIFIALSIVRVMLVD